jgi:hypothetical protein
MARWNAGREMKCAGAWEIYTRPMELTNLVCFEKLKRF